MPEHSSTRTTAAVSKIYKYRIGRRTLTHTCLHLVVFAALGFGLYFLYEGGYLSAWFTSFVAAVIALMALSIPRRIILDDEGLHILCLLDITELRHEEIAAVRRVERRELRWLLPLFGGYGFFGYYGHFLDLKHLERVRLYASEWRDLIEITDIYENRILVSCSRTEELTRDLQEAIARNRHTQQQECAGTPNEAAPQHDDPQEA